METLLKDRRICDGPAGTGSWAQEAPGRDITDEKRIDFSPEKVLR